MSIGVFVLFVLAISPLVTWVFNKTRSSVFIAILTHASVNPALTVVPGELFPGTASTLLPFTAAFGMLAVVLIVVTGGRPGLPRSRLLNSSDARHLPARPLGSPSG